MLARLLAFALLSTSTSIAQADFDRTVPASVQPDLYISTPSGHIHVHPGDDTQIHISAHLKAGWNAGGDIQARMHRIAANPPIQVSGNTIRVGNFATEERDLYKDITIDYDIAAPRAVALNLRSGSGDIEIAGAGRFSKIETGSGSVKVRGVSGPADLHSGSGDIEVEEHGPGGLRASTGSGSIHATGVQGSLQLRTGSGDLQADGHLAGAATLETGSGSIRLHLGSEARFNLEASTGSGSIHVAQAGAPRDTEKHHLSGPINGGGPVVKASTGSGDVSID